MLLLLVVAISVLWVFPAFAESESSDSVEISAQTDKPEYFQGEEIRLTIAVDALNPLLIRSYFGASPIRWVRIEFNNQLYVGPNRRMIISETFGQPETDTVTHKVYETELTTAFAAILTNDSIAALGYLAPGEYQGWVEIEDQKSPRFSFTINPYPKHLEVLWGHFQELRWQRTYGFANVKVEETPSLINIYEHADAFIRLPVGSLWRKRALETALLCIKFKNKRTGWTAADSLKTLRCLDAYEWESPQNPNLFIDLVKSTLLFDLSKSQKRKALRKLIPRYHNEELTRALKKE